jgi:hypothetical protein
MAKFCTKCGKTLVEGQPCTCEASNQNIQATQLYQEQTEPLYTNQPEQQLYMNQQTQQAYVAQQANGSDISTYLKNIFRVFKNILRFPVTEGSMFVISEDRNSAFGLIGIQAIFSALFALVVSSKINSLIKLISAYAMGETIKMPFFKIFIVTVIASFGLSCALAGILLGISHLFKNKISFRAALCVAATRSVVLVLVTMISIVLFYINAGAGVILFYMGNLAGICYMVNVLPITSQENKNKTAMIVFISIVIFAIISMFVMSKCAPYYLPEAIKDSVDTIMRLITNPSDFFESFMSDLY